MGPLSDGIQTSQAIERGLTEPTAPLWPTYVPGQVAPQLGPLHHPAWCDPFLLSLHLSLIFPSSWGPGLSMTPKDTVSPLHGTQC